MLFVGCYALPPLLPYSYTDLDYYALQQPPSPTHWFGTNALGQDLLALTLRGMQKSLLIGVCVAFISTIIAATVGAIAGYFGGWRDRTPDVDRRPAAGGAELHPDRDRHPATRGSPARVFWLILLLSVFSWMISSRIVRGMTMSLREREFVVAARYMGVQQLADHRSPHPAERRIAPHHRHHAQRRRRRSSAETGLSFLGFGVQPPDVSLGTLIADGTRSVTTFPWVFLFPAGVLVLIVLCANLIGDGLRDAIDPRRAPPASGGTQR